MSKTSGYTYDIFMRNGNTITLNNINNINLEFQNRQIVKFSIEGNSVNSDELRFIDIGQILAIVKRVNKKKWIR